MIKKFYIALILIFSFLPFLSSTENLIAKRDNIDSNLLSINDIQIKSYYDAENIYFTFNFLEDSEKRSHKSWRWDPLMQHYVQDTDRETIFSILIQSSDANFADLWVWRSFLTDPVGTAEDMYVLGYDNQNQVNNLLRIIPDDGQRCWTLKYYDDFYGERLPRFSHRLPTGSMADVSAKSSWQNGSWQLTLSRKLDTTHNDDLKFERGKTYRITIFKGIPGETEVSSTIVLMLQ